MSATVLFNEVPPSAAMLVTALRQHTGELVAYNAEAGELSCSVLNERFTVVCPDTEHTYWTLLTTNLLGGYLWSASLAVLQALGSTYSSKLPAWAYKPWREAQYEYEQHDVAWITLDEARCLGLE